MDMAFIRHPDLINPQSLGSLARLISCQSSAPHQVHSQEQTIPYQSWFVILNCSIHPSIAANSINNQGYVISVFSKAALRSTKAR